MSYYILAHRKKRIEALDLGGVFDIEILGIEAGATTLLAEEDSVDDVSGDSGDEEIIGVEVIVLNEAGELEVETILGATSGGDTEIIGDQGDEEIEGELDEE